MADEGPASGGERAGAESLPLSSPGPATVRNAALTVIAVAVVVAALRAAAVIIVPLVFAGLLSYALDPIVSWLTRRKLPRGVAAVVVMLAVTGGVAATTWVLWDDALGLVEQLPEAAQQLRAKLQRQRAGAGETPIDKVQEAAEQLEGAASEAMRQPPRRGVTRVQVEQPPLGLRDYLVAGSWSAVAFAGQVVVIFFLTLYLLASGDLFKRKLVRLVGPSLSKMKVTVQILDEINDQIARFLLQRAVVSLVVAFATWIALRAFGMNHAGLWGIGAGVANTVPYLGPAVVAAGVAVAGFLQFDSLGMAAGVAGATMVVTGFEGYLLTPWLTGRLAKMNEVSVFFGLLFWGWLWGIWGMLLAVPIMMVLKSVCDRVEDLKPIGDLMGE